MRLFEHAEFEQAMLRAAENFAVNEQFIEKDLTCSPPELTG